MVEIPTTESECAMLRAEVLRLTNALAEATTGWQPIETAPTDGTEVLVWAPPAHGLPGLRAVAAYHPDAGWTVCEFREATHWRPLPAAPESPDA